MAHIVTVTGATGNVGKALCEKLLQKGVKVRAVARSLEKLALLESKGAESCPGDLQDVNFLAEAFAGADALFAMIPAHVTSPDFCTDLQRTATTLVEAVKRSGVSKVVALSAVGAELASGTGPMTGLHKFESLLRSLPHLSVIALRPSYFMENLLSGIPMIKQAGFFGGVVSAHLRHPMIAARDIAAVAAGYLLEPVFTGYTVRELLGPRDYTHQEATAIIANAVGQPGLAYTEFSYEDFRQRLLAAGFSHEAAGSYVEMFTAFNTGRIQPATARNETNTTPTTLEQFVAEVFVPAFQAS